MQTVKQIEKLWSQGRSNQLFATLTVGRPESAFVSLLQAERPSVAAAAMAIIRLDELCQAHVRFYGELVRSLIGQQDADGGWGDPMLTALCVRALLASQGSGQSIDAGLNYLANLQQTDGIWPRLPFRRLPGDALTSAFILSQLGPQSRFRAAVDFDRLTEWFATHVSVLDTATRKLWQRVELRCCRWTTPATDDHARLLTLWTA